TEVRCDSWQTRGFLYPCQSGLRNRGHHEDSWARARRRVYESNLLGFEVFIVPMYHPAAALYNAKYRDELDKDFQLLKLELKRLG
ncbi:MAG: hypothetical protein OEY39_04700, partial [Candidatus Bathyarchaeota archaeon]|nr:hypothetical protein [Candidatus Bathyarchaeota archaeon]